MLFPVHMFPSPRVHASRDHDSSCREDKDGISAHFGGNNLAGPIPASLRNLAQFCPSCTSLSVACSFHLMSCNALVTLNETRESSCDQVSVWSRLHGRDSAMDRRVGAA